MTILYQIKFHFADDTNVPGVFAPTGHSFVEYIQYDTNTNQYIENEFAGFWPGGSSIGIYGSGEIVNDERFLLSPNITSQTLVVNQSQYEAAKAQINNWNLNKNYSFLTQNCVDFAQAIYEAAGQAGNFVTNLFNGDVSSDVGIVSTYADIKYGSGVIGDVANVFVNLISVPVNGVAVLLNGASDLVSFIGSGFNGSVNDFFKEIFGEEKVTDTEEYKANKGDTGEIVEGFGGSISEEDYTSITSGGVTVSVTKAAATTDIEGNTYLITEVIDSVVSAGEELGRFVYEKGAGLGDYITNGLGFQQALAGFLSTFKDDIINENLSADEAFVEFVKIYAVNYLLTPTPTVQDSLEALGKYFEAELGLSGVDSHLAVESVYSSFVQIASVFILSSDGWEGEDYAIAAGTIIAANIATAVIKNLIGDSAPLPPGVTQGVGTIINSLFNNENLEDTDYLNAFLSISFGFDATVFDGNALEIYINTQLEAAALLAFAYAGPLGYAVVKLIGEFAISKLYTGKVYYEGEYGDLGALLNSIYQVQQVEVSDGNGGTMLVDALVATNGNGSTIIAQAGITHIIGNGGGDVLVGDGGGVASDDTLIGNEGSDYLEGKQGNDSLVGGNGNDHISGGEGEDYLSGGSGDDLLFGDDGADIILADDGNDFIHGGRHDDTIAAGAGIDLVLGGGGNDTILADDGDDMVDGGAGDDAINGGAGADIILGNLGNDVIEGDDGADVIFGDEGNDSINGGFGNDFIDGGDGVDILQGNNGNDLINGGAGDDYADGGLGDDGIKGGAGADILLGGMDDDLLYGEDGNDLLQGGDGDDILLGGIGSDVLQGGSGDDIYGFDVLSADSDNVIDDESGDNDIISLNWLTETEADANLTLTRDGDDLVINYDGRDITTVTDHFNGKAVEKIEIEQGKIIDLTALTIGTGGVAAFTVAAAGSGESADEKITARIEDINTNLQVKEAYWNNGFIQNLSELAYQEALKDQIENEFYNGSEVTSYYRNRGKFGGKYTIYKLDVAGNIDGTAELFGLELLGENYNPIQYAEIYNDITEVTSHLEFTISPETSSGSSVNIHFSITVKDYWQNDELLFSKTSSYTSSSISGSSIINQETYSGTYLGNAAEQDGLLFWVSQDGMTYETYNPTQRLSMGTSTTVTVGYKELQSGADQLVGGFWNEIINGNSGDDILIGNGGDDVINGDAGDDWLFGGDGDDEANGGEGDDTIFGGNGDDTIDGGNGDDSIISGSGDDEIYGQGGNDWIDAGAGVDIIYGGEGDDIIYAGDGDDYAEGGEGIDVIYGQGGNDIIYGNEGTDYLYGEEGNDTIYGVEEDDNIYGGSGNDILRGEGGNDNIYGGEGSDTITGGAGADIIDGGDDFDYVTYSLSLAGITIDLEDSSLNSGGDAEGDVLTNIQAVFGSDYDDHIYGNAELNHLVDRAGNDFIYGRNGNDWLFSVSGTDYFDGGDGSDFLSYQFSGSAVTVSLLANTASGGSAAGDTLVSIENLQGSSYNDTLYGNHSANVLMGKEGNDTLSGQGGNDILYGNAGDDSLWGSADNDTIYGGDGNDMLNGGTEDDTLYGEAGNDTLYGAAGNDVLYGDAGNDILRGDAGNDTIHSLEGDDDVDGGDGDDIIYASSYNSLIVGGSGTDTLNYTAVTSSIIANLVSNTASGTQIGLHSILGFERLVTGSGDDTIYGTSNSDVLDGYMGNDTIYGGSGSDTIYGGAGNDTLRGESGDDTIYGGTGNDTILGGTGADIIDGNEGFNYVSYSFSSAGVTIDLEDNNLNAGGEAAGDILTNIQSVYGSDYDDYIYGSSVMNHLIDRAGNDFIYGRGGDDSLFSVSGTDYFDGGDGSDFLSYQFSGAAVTVSLVANTASGGSAEGDIFVNIENLQGSAYNDFLYGDGNVNVLIGLAGNDTMYGYGGNDYLYGDAGNDTLYGNGGDDYLAGWDGNDTIFADIGNDTIYGEAGDDYLAAWEGNDIIYGGTGNDLMFGEAGDDILYGEDGIDTIYGGSGLDSIYAGSGNDTVYGEAGDDYLAGGDGNDTIFADIGNDTIYGEAGDDYLAAWEGNDTVYGGTGNDLIFGEAGDDILYGEDGIDTILGDTGNDILEGGGGYDYLTGGEGADIFVFSNLSHSTTSARDIITDYLDGTDKIKVTGLAASVAEFSITQSGGNTFVTDLDSSFSFQINGLVTLENNDFIFV